MGGTIKVEPAKQSKKMKRKKLFDDFHITCFRRQQEGNDKSSEAMASSRILCVNNSVSRTRLGRNDHRNVETSLANDRNCVLDCSFFVDLFSCVRVDVESEKVCMGKEKQ